MSKSKRLVFFGTEDFSQPSLQALIKDGWTIAAVVTKPDSPAGRGQQLSAPKVKAVAEEARIKLLQPGKMSNVEAELKKIQPDFGVLVAYGKLIPDSTLRLFPNGIINLHPSLLPRYRGPAPIEAAILNGDKQTGLSLMLLDSELDAGPVFAQQTVKLAGTETRPALYEKLAEAGAKLLVKKLPDILDGTLKPLSQDVEHLSYTKLIRKDDGIMDWSKPAAQLEREVRAYLGWPRSVTRVFGQKIIVTKARLAKDKSDGALVMRARPGYLEIQELVAPSGRSMSGADFIKGYKK